MALINNFFALAADKLFLPLQISSDVIGEYAEISTVHGVRHLANRRFKTIEKVFWAVWIVASFVICGKLLTEVWLRWNGDPVVVTLSGQPRPVWTAPFPAVTICPETKTTGKFNFTKSYHVLDNGVGAISNEEKAQMEAVAQLCDTHLSAGWKIGGNFTDSRIFGTLRSLAPPFNKTVYACKWRNAIGGCSEYFTDVWTEDGLCHTFNILDNNDIFSELVHQPIPLLKRRAQHKYGKRRWWLEKGYTNDEAYDESMYPREMRGPGVDNGLNVVMKLNSSELDYVCRGPVTGFKVLLHLPGDLPHIKHRFIRIPLEQETLVVVNPKIRSISDELAAYPPEKRGCYFSHEGTLKYFKEYTYQNCELECLADYTYEKCGCVKFSMPRDNSTPICGFQKFHCIAKLFNEMLDKRHVNHITGNPDICNCLPTCNQIEYDYEVSQTELVYREMFNAFMAPIGMRNNGERYVRLSVQVKEFHMNVEKRAQLYNRTDLLALTGGILALFLGASFVSFVEFIYFFTVRMYMKRFKAASMNTIMEFDNRSTVQFAAH